MRRALSAIALACAGASCSLLPPRVECGPLEPTECEQRTRTIVAESLESVPTRRLVQLTFIDDKGSYSAEFDDGTGTMLIVD